MGDWGDKRPEIRADCIGKPRPCPWVLCKYHLGVEVSRTGALWPAIGPAWPIRRAHGRAASGADRTDEIADSLMTYYRTRPCCALDVADQGGVTLEAIAEAVGGITREAVRKVQDGALAKIGSDLRGFG